MEIDEIPIVARAVADATAAAGNTDNAGALAAWDVAFNRYVGHFGLAQFVSLTGGASQREVSIRQIEAWNRIELSLARASRDCYLSLGNWRPSDPNLRTLRRQVLRQMRQLGTDLEEDTLAVLESGLREIGKHDSFHLASPRRGSGDVEAARATLHLDANRGARRDALHLLSSDRRALLRSLEPVLKIRSSTAHRMGYRTWAEWRLRCNWVGNSEAVLNYLEHSIVALAPTVLPLLEEASGMSTGDLGPEDIAFATRRADDAATRAASCEHNTVDGILEQFSGVFSLTTAVVRDAPFAGQTWRLEVSPSAAGPEASLLLTIAQSVVDQSVASFSTLPLSLRDDASRHVAVVIPKQVAGKAMSPASSTALLHELGHALDALRSPPGWAVLSALRAQRDVVELGGVLCEELARGRRCSDSRPAAARWNRLRSHAAAWLDLAAHIGGPEANTLDQLCERLNNLVGQRRLFVPWQLVSRSLLLGQDCLAYAYPVARSIADRFWSTRGRRGSDRTSGAATLLETYYGRTGIDHPSSVISNLMEEEWLWSSVR